MSTEQASISDEPAPGRRDPAARKNAILRAATEIIVEEGHTALTHRAVAKRAGVALGSTTQYFTSIEDLREEALKQLATEIDEGLAEMEHMLPGFAENPESAIPVLHEFLCDTRQVHASISLNYAGTNDPHLRELATRWADRVIAMLSEYIGRERATAITLYLDGATVHASLHSTPVSRQDLLGTIRALLAMPSQQ